MSVAAANIPVSAPAVPEKGFWLRNRRWDLLFITMSVILVPLPYLVYLLLSSPNIGIDADAARNGINIFIAIAIGGPHMMSTFLRTNFDREFKERYPMLIRSSIIIPIVVVSLAFLNLNLLLTVFFFWAAIHVLHQITYIVELYNHKEHTIIRRGSAVTPLARLIDLAVIFTCLFPFAALKISMGQFDVGQNDLTEVIPDFFEQTWLFAAASAIFAVALTAFLVKSYREYKNNIINWPKTIFILLTVGAAFTIPALPNLDTAFQGLNTWHSFQYLAITYYILKVKQEYGTLNQSAPMVARFSRMKDSWGLFLVSTLMLAGPLTVAVIVYIVGGLIGRTGPQQFDTAYYTGILSFLWIHYYYDHFLFTNFEALDESYGH